MIAYSAAAFATQSADASCLKTPQLTRRTNLNIRLADQNIDCAGQPHKRDAQLSITTVEPLNYQLTTDFDGLGEHQNLTVLLPTLNQGHPHRTTKKAPHKSS